LVTWKWEIICQWKFEWENHRNILKKTAINEEFTGKIIEVNGRLSIVIFDCDDCQTKSDVVGVSALRL